MKRFTAILFALSFLLSLNAASATQIQKPAKGNKQQLMEWSKAKKANRPHSVLSEVRGWQETNYLKTAKARKAPKAAETVEISDCYSTFYPDVNAIWYSLSTEDWSKSFYFSIYTPKGKRDVVLGKTYTLADMEEDENYWDDDDWNSHYLTAASFTKTQGQFYDVHVVADVTDEDGNEFHLVYDEKPIVMTGDTVDVTIVSPRPDAQYSSDGAWLLRTQSDENSEYNVQLSYYSNNSVSPAGSFSGEDIDLVNSLIVVFTDSVDVYGDTVVMFLEVKDASIVVKDGAETLKVTGHAVAEDGNVYRLNLTMTKPQASQNQTITSRKLYIDDEWFDLTGDVKLAAADENNQIILVIYPEGLKEQLTGDYLFGPGGGYNYGGVVPDEGEESSVYSGAIHVEYTNGNIAVTGAVLCFNNIEYTLDLMYIKPEKTREETLEFAAVDLGVFDDGWMVSGFSADTTKYISLAAEKEEIAGTYTEEDLILDGCYVVTDNTAESYKFFSVVEANLNISYTEEDSTALISGTLLCINGEDGSDVPLFTISVKATKPDPFAYDQEKDFSATIDEYDIDINYLENGNVFIAGKNAAGATVALQVYVPEDADGLPVGEYPINTSRDAKTVQASKGMEFGGAINYSIAGYSNKMNQFSEIWFLVSGKIVVAENGEITLDAYNTKGKHVEAQLKALQHEIINIVLGQCNKVVLDVDQIEYEMIDENNLFSCHLVFTLPEGAEDIELDKQYTFADIEGEQSYIGTRGNEYKILDATFIKSIDDKEVAHAFATATDAWGKIYHMTYDENSFRPTGETIRVEFEAPVEVSFDADWNEWQIRAENDSTLVEFLLIGDAELQLVGDLTEHVELGWNTALEYIIGEDDEGMPNWLYVQIHEVKSLVLSGEEDNYALEASVLGEDGVLYQIAVNKAFEAIDTVNSNAPRASKRLVNGQLIIELNGVQYNVLGTKVR